MRRKRMKRSRSRKLFKRTSGSNRRNRRSGPMRGGYRL